MDNTTDKTATVTLPIQYWQTVVAALISKRISYLRAGETPEGVRYLDGVIHAVESQSGVCDATA